MSAISTLKDEYKGEVDLNEGLALAVKILAKSMDLTSADASKFEIGVVQLNENGEVIQRRVEGDELARILAESKAFDKPKEGN